MADIEKDVPLNETTAFQWGTEDSNAHGDDKSFDG
jgi:hypothetical protein